MLKISSDTAWAQAPIRKMTQVIYQASVAKLIIKYDTRMIVQIMTLTDLFIAFS